MGWKEHVTLKQITAETEQIECLLDKRFKNIKAYRYNPASIRVRIVDKKFEGKSDLQRDAMVEPLLAKLPDDLRFDITLLLLLTPAELKDSPLNTEFEHPSPSRL